MTKDRRDVENAVDVCGGAAILIRVESEFGDESPRNPDHWFKLLTFYLERIL